MPQVPIESDLNPLPATRPPGSFGARFLGWFLLFSSVGLVSCQSLFYL
jgi:hypothetical protein